jgi:hypothetical protein
MTEEEKNLRAAICEHDQVEALVQKALKGFLGEEHPELQVALREAVTAIWVARRKLYEELAVFDGERRKEAGLAALRRARGLKECCEPHGPEEEPYW